MPTFSPRLLVAPLLALAACDSAVGSTDAVPNEPVLSFPADLLASAAPSSDGPIAVAVFWLPPGAPDADPAALSEDTEAAVALSLDAPLVVNVLAPPPASAYGDRDWALGLVLAYADADGDGAFTPGEAVVGGAPGDYVVHAGADIPGERSPFRRDLPAGYYTVAEHDLACPFATAEPGGSCADGVGAACTDDSDCGALGVCRQTLGDRALPGGYCAKRADCTSARLVGGPGFDELDALFAAPCTHDADCRVGEGYVCELLRGYVRACLPPAAPICDVTVGAPCSDDDDCGADGRCLTTAPTFGTFPGGACTVDEADADCRPTAARFVAVDVDDTRVALAECRRDADCRAGYRCEPRVDACVPDAGTCETLGAACTSDAECGDGGRCADFDADLGELPGGMCLVAYGAQGCGYHNATAVTTAPDHFNWMLPSCGADADCRTDAGYWCNRGLGACVPPASEACEVDLGAPCERDADCGAGRCLTDTPLQPIPSFPGGYCTASNGSGCRLSDGVYYPLFSDRGLLARCDGDTACRAGYRCDFWRGACVPERRVGVDLGAPFTLALPRCP